MSLNSLIKLFLSYLNSRAALRCGGVAVDALKAIAAAAVGRGLRRRGGEVGQHGVGDDLPGARTLIAHDSLVRFLIRELEQRFGLGQVLHRGRGPT